MTGKNKITLCPAEMTRAVQHYFETVLFRKDACPKVSAVRQTTGLDPSFEVDVSGDVQR